MEENTKIITRFAPSPTGFMHVGGVRTALFAYLFAKKNNGVFILRIEDTDKEREVEGSIVHIIDSLKWLGINWNEGPDIEGPNAPYIQSKRLDSYKKYAQFLVEKGLAYADPYTEEELQKFREQAALEKRPFLYRNHRPENPPIWDGTMPLRLKITDIKSYKWNDLVRGELEAGEEALDDFILIKSDGYPTYNFAHIIDDLEMKVTHIFRADEFISSTPKFLALYEALGIKRPEFVTLPPIIGPDGKKKLGKRDGAKDVLEYKNEGYLPEAFFNFLAFIGWNPGGEKEIMSEKELIEAFDIKHIQSGGAKFNEEKLRWFNREHMLKLPYEIYKEEVLEWMSPEIRNKDGFNKRIDKIMPIIRDRISVYGEIKEMEKEGEFGYYFEMPNYEKEGLLCPEKLRKNGAVTLDDVKKRLKEEIEILEKISDEDFNDSEKIKTALWDYATEHGRGVVLWAMRFALSGKEKSPDPFTLASILEKNETLKRLRNAIGV